MTQSQILTKSTQVVAYARVSSKEQEKEGFSIPAQIRLLQDYAKMSSLNIAKEFVDVETAKKSGRTSFSEMLTFVKANPKIKAILVEKTDRLYRNIKDWVILDDLRLEIHFIKENVILSENSRSSEKFMHGIKVLMAKNFIDNLSEEVRKGMTEKATQGLWPSFAPLGYRNVTDIYGKKNIAIDPEAAPYVTKAFNLYATGTYSLKEIAALLRKDGFVFRKSRNSVPLTTIHKILRNRIYTGEFDWGNKVYKGCYEPLVTMATWMTVQDIFDNRSARRKKVRKHDFAFSGLIQCGYTGGSLVGDLKKGKYVYYRAAGAKGVPYVKEEELERQFGEALQTLHFDEDVLEWVRQALKESHGDKHKHQEETFNRLQTEYARLESRINNMYTDKLDQKISEAFFEEKAGTWREEQKKIMVMIEALQNSGQTYFNEGIQLLELAQSAGHLFMRQSAHEKRRLLNFMVSNCIWKDGLLTVNFKKPFDMLNKFTLKSIDSEGQKTDSTTVFESWRSRRDSNARPQD